MTGKLHFDDFLTSMCKDARLKNRIILWTMLFLVLPTALLVTVGVPEKQAYAIMAVLVFPLQLVIYFRSVRQQSQFSKRPHNIFLGRATVHDSVSKHRNEPEIVNPVLAHPDADHADWHYILQNLKVQEVVMVAPHHSSVGGWKQALNSLKVQSSVGMEISHSDLHPENVLIPSAREQAVNLTDELRKDRTEQELLKRAEAQRQKVCQSFFSSARSVPAGLAIY